MDAFCENEGGNSSPWLKPGSSLSQSLKAFGVAPAITVSNARGKTLTVRASDVYAARMRFLAGLGTDQGAFALTSVGDKLVEQFFEWLLHEYSDRYRSIVAEDQLAWLRQVAILVVVRHLLEQKYTGYIEQGRQTFADPWACSEMCRLQILHALPGELARLVHHIVHEPERQQTLIDQFHSDLEARLRGGMFAPPGALPPLQGGAGLPFAPLSQAKGGER